MKKFKRLYSIHSKLFLNQLKELNQEKKYEEVIKLYKEKRENDVSLDASKEYIFVRRMKLKFRL